MSECPQCPSQYSKHYYKTLKQKIYQVTIHKGHYVDQNGMQEHTITIYYTVHLTSAHAILLLVSLLQTLDPNANERQRTMII